MSSRYEDNLEVINDIADALFELKVAFEKHSLPAPTMMCYEDIQTSVIAKRDLSCTLNQTNLDLDSRIHIKSITPDSVIQIAGFKIK